jgi:ATP-dependent Clp protease adaptor protein ClpS
MPEYDDDRQLNGDILEDEDEDVKEPDMFRVLLHNDHYTTMEFVVEVLRVVFHKSVLEATKIMFDVHRKGIGVVGTFTLDIAQTKTEQVRTMAEKREFPLRCTFEKL